MAIFRKTKTVESITAALQKTVKDLEAHSTQQDLERSKKKAEADRLYLEAIEHGDEAFKARNVAEKVGALLS